MAELRKPIRWNKDGQDRDITHLILTARWVGGALKPGMRNTPVGIAYVTDQVLLDESVLDFSRCAYVAIGVADAI